MEVNMEANLSLHQIKVLALYTVAEIQGPVPRHVIETALALCNVNIFQIQEALYNLLENGNLTQQEDEDNVPYLIATDQGKCVAEELRKDIGLSYREKAVAYATIEINKLRQAIGVEASVEERTKLGQTDYFCHVSLSDAGLPLMNLSLFAPNRIHAEMMAERFRKDPLTVYQKVLQILTGTDDSPKDENKTTEE